MVKITNKQQFEYLVSLMCQNPDIARGYIKSGKDFKTEQSSLWDRFAEELNSFGPPTRNTNKWIMVWGDMKFKIRKKMAHNKSELKATGGGPNKLFTFTALEETVIDLLQIDKAFNPPGRAFGNTINLTTAVNVEARRTPPSRTFGNTTSFNILTPENNRDRPCSSNPLQPNSSSSLQPNNKNMECLENINSSDIEGETISNSRVTPRNMRNNKDASNLECRRLNLLEVQTKIHSQMCTEVKSAAHNCEIYMRDTLSFTKKAYYLKKDKFEFLKEIEKEKLKLYKEDLKSKQKARAEKLKLKVQILELQQKQLEIHQQP